MEKKELTEAVVKLVKEGASFGKIAKKLGISKTQAHNIFKKSESENASERSVERSVERSTERSTERSDAKSEQKNYYEEYLRTKQALDSTRQALENVDYDLRIDIAKEELKIKREKQQQDFDLEKKRIDSDQEIKKQQLALEKEKVTGAKQKKADKLKDDLFDSVQDFYEILPYEEEEEEVDVDEVSEIVQTMRKNLDELEKIADLENEKDFDFIKSLLKELTQWASENANQTEADLEISDKNLKKLEKFIKKHFPDDDEEED